MADELKPCPFCGGRALIVTTYEGDNHKYLAVHCVDCRAKTSDQWSDDPCPQTYAEVRDRWNTRHQPNGGADTETERLARAVVSHLDDGSLDTSKLPHGMGNDLRNLRSELDKTNAGLRNPNGGAGAFTTGHCANKAKPGGCPLHNLQCGYPQCDRKPAQASAGAEDARDAVRWRKLRSFATNAPADVDHVEVVFWRRSKGHIMEGVELDAAIDAARTAKEQP